MQQEFLKLYDRHVDAIFRYCLRQTGDREAAKNLTQETFQKMWDYHTPQESFQEVNDSSLRAIAHRLLRQHKAKQVKMFKTFTFNFSN